MADEYQLRKDIDELYFLVWDTASDSYKLLTIEEFNKYKTDIDGQIENIYVLLDSKQATLVSGVNIKTINNNSLLGSGNITIEGGGGGGSVIGTGSFSIDNNGHLIVELPNGVDNPYFINNNGHLIYDTSNTYNGD